MKSLLTAFFASMLLVIGATAQTARVQIIHNAPDPTVDIYVNGALALDNFEFRAATPFIDLPAGLPLSVAVAPGTSTSVADAIATFPVIFESGKTYAITASGLVGDPNTPFTLIADDAARDSGSDPGKVDLNVLHGSPDAPAVDVVVRTGGKIVSNLAYGQFTPYLSVDPGVYYLDIKPAGSDAIVQTYRADLTGLGGTALRVFASGLLGGSPAFGLFAALPNGTVVELPAAPVARVQVIHNSPSPTVDVYANADLLLDNFEYRTATSFIFVPAGVNITLGIAADTSTSAASAIATFDVNLDNGKTYIVTASGIVGDPNTPFTLLINDAGREAASDTNNVDIAVLHGSTNAPAVDVDAVFVADNVITNLAYGENTGYLGLPPAKYDFAVRAAGDPNVVASFRADLSGLKGGAAYVFASGLLGGTPAFGLFAALPNGDVLELPLTPTARVQVIHNSPDPTVDVYAGNTLLLDNFAFRTATPFINVPADRDITLGVALENSVSVGDVIAPFDVNLENGKTYIVTAAGVVGNPNTPFTLIVNDAGREAAANSGNVDIAVLHGSTNAPAVDVDAVFVADNAISNLAYGQFTPYLSLPPAKYDFAVRPAGNPAVVASFRADLSGLAGGAAYVFASGLLGGTPAFGLFAALPNGNVLELPLTPTARLQVIHNSPDPTVDVYAGNTLLLDNFAFRTATPYISVPADRDITLGIAGENSTSASDALASFDVNLDEGGTYAVMATGIVGNPGSPFTLVVDADAREAAQDPNNAEFNVTHGSPDAPSVDIAVVGVGTIINGLSYPDFTGYFSVPAASYLVQVLPAGTSDVLATYRADLSSLTGSAIRVFASGLLNGTPGFGLFAALADGTVLELPLVTAPKLARVQVIHNSPSPVVDVYANDDLLLDDFSYRTATPFIDVPAEVDIALGIALGNSTSSNDVIATFNVNLEEGKTYIVTASGIVGDPNTPFNLIINPTGQETSADPNNVDIAVLHGSTNAPAVDVDAVFVANNVISNLSYGQYTPYLGLVPGKYDFAVRGAGDPNVVASFRADLSGLAGGAAYVFASGLLGGTPAFGLFAALPNGDVLELPLTPTARVQVIHNSPNPTVDVYAGNTMLLDNFAFRTATPYIDVPADRDIAFGIALPNSTSSADVLATFNVNLAEGSTNGVMAIGVVGNPTRPFNLLVDTNARETAPAGQVGVSVLHGSPDAPAVDVVERLDGPLVTNLQYGVFTPYLDLTATDGYFLDIKPAGVDQIVATFRADLQALDGQAIRVFASGFLGSTPGFGLFAALPNGTVVELPFSPVARVQIVHNAPSPTVDVYANGFPVLNDFEFLQATSFGYLPAGFPITLAVAPASSTSAADAFYSTTATLENGKTYLVVAAGEAGNPNAPFGLLVNDMGRERAIDPDKIELAVLHGSPDAPAVDVRSYDSGAALVSDLAFGEFSPYLTLDPDELLVDLTPANTPNTIVGTWGADLSQLPGLVGVVMATGFVGSNPELDLVLVLPNGLVLPLVALTRVQVIHNSPNPNVDVYLDGNRVLNDFAFRQATEIGLLPARVPLELAVAPENSTSVNDAIYTLPVGGLDIGKTYIIMAAGVVGDPNTPFQLYVNADGRDRSQSAGTVDLALFHGAPDAPEVDVQVPPSTILFDNIAFGEFSNYVSVPAANYTVQVTPANDNSTIVQSYTADVSSLGGQAATVFASGFLAGQPGFEVWVALTDGTTFPLPVFVSANELDGKLQSLRLAPNPAVSETWVRFDLTEGTNLRYAVRDLAGRVASEGDFGFVPAGPFAYRVDVGTLPAGMYNLEVRSENGVQVQKFVVSRQ